MPQNTQISLKQPSNATEFTELADQLRQELVGGLLHCQVYQNRPTPCRAYDCRDDTRIWADFANRIVSSELEKLFSNPVVEEVKSP